MQKRVSAPIISVSLGDWLVRHALALSIAAFTFVVLAGFATMAMGARSTEADALVVRTFDALRVSRALMLAAQDAETGQRGFLLSQENSYLAPFEAAEEQLPKVMSDLAAFAKQDPALQQLVAEMQPLITAKLEELRTTIALQRGGKRDEAIARVKSGVGKDLMDKIRLKQAAFDGNLQSLLNVRQSDAQAYRSYLLILVAVSLATATGLAALLGRAAQQSIGALRVRTHELEVEAERRQAVEQTLRQAQKMEAVGQLTGGVAHDFNNLLTIIIGNLDTLRRRLGTANADALTIDFLQTLMRPVDFALQGARNAAQLTHRLLAFSRQQPLEPTRIDLNRTIADLSDMLRRTLGERVDVETVLAGGLWPALADGNQVENALLNLAINARDAMPDGGRLTIETANTHLDDAYARRFGDVTPGQYVTLSVTDTGSGIAPDVLQRVFEPFFTTKPHGQGSGLGLAMIHGFVKQSGGHIRIYSEVGQGTTVRIYLPRLIEAEIPTSAPAARKASSDDVPRARDGETLLIVEDNEGVRAYAAATLEEMGYAILQASDAREAITFLDNGSRVDLLFTDVVLTGAINGRQIAEQFVAKNPKLPVLFTTGYTRNAIVHGGRLDPHVHLLSKPYAQQDLVRKVRELLDATGRPS